MNNVKRPGITKVQNFDYIKCILVEVLQLELMIFAGLIN